VDLVTVESCPHLLEKAVALGEGVPRAREVGAEAPFEKGPDAREGGAVEVVEVLRSGLRGRIHDRELPGQRRLHAIEHHHRHPVLGHAVEREVDADVVEPA